MGMFEDDHETEGAKDTAARMALAQDNNPPFGKRPPGALRQFYNLMVANYERAKLWNGINTDGSPVYKGMLFCAVELGGEVGEILNVVKKLEREKLGMAGSRASLDDLKDEVGDGIICLFLLAAEAGFDPMQAAYQKFNKTSRKLGFPIEMHEEP